ncbi:MAG TPA: FxsB family cyclophane-forming radical SAM/SPASM peptide maturase [Streptosporangiaceae bacterium]
MNSGGTGTARHPLWPHQLLNVAAVRAAGISPQPFRQFVLKIYSRCNLSCSYCYVYELADQSWRHQPHVMSPYVVRATIDRIAEHTRAHGLPALRVTLHGGEPLLSGASFIEDLAGRLRRALPPGVAVDLAVQTNGTCLDEAMLAVLRRNGIRVGVSIDGSRAATDRHRRYPSGRSSHAEVTRALELLRTGPNRIIYAGLLATIGLENDPVETYESLLIHEPPMIDFLLPHGTWSSPPPFRPPDTSAPYADWLLKVFTRWAAATRQETSIRLFDAIISQLVGSPSTTEAIGLGAADTIVIDTDGAIKQIDPLSAAYDNAAATGLTVMRHALDRALDHPTTVARQMGLAALGPECQACAVRDICGGGYYPHRYRAGEGFRNPSVYCPDLMRLITRIRDYVSGEVARLADRSRHS